MLSFGDDKSQIIHLIGIGGIGMSGIAEILHSLGYTVQGSDKSKSLNIERLEKLGIISFIGHSIKNIEKANIVVYSSAIKDDNIELSKAREIKIPCVTRAEILSQIVRLKKSVVIAGSHGKTTVTSICASILEMAAFDPTVVNGGIINLYKTNAKLGSGEWNVIESDESDGSFVKFFPTIGIITNIDKEHIKHYGSFENLKLEFKRFLNNIQIYGIGIVCIDDNNINEVIKDVLDRRIITYSIKNDADFKAINIRKDKDGSIFDVIISNNKDINLIRDIKIPLFGDHNIKNSLAAIAMSIELSIDIDILKSALSSFTGANRRFTNIGDINNALVVDDYAHHPTEIEAVLDAAKQKSSKNVIIICQPHRFTRLNSLFDEFCKCFNKADQVIITDVYKADDIEISNITSKDLYQNILLQKNNTLFAKDKEEVENILIEMKSKNQISKGDVIIFAGAGDISKWAHEIVSKIGNHHLS